MRVYRKPSEFPPQNVRSSLCRSPNESNSEGESFAPLLPRRRRRRTQYTRNTAALAVTIDDCSSSSSWLQCRWSVYYLPLLLYRRIPPFIITTPRVNQFGDIDKRETRAALVRFRVFGMHRDADIGRRLMRYSSYI